MISNWVNLAHVIVFHFQNKEFYELAKDPNSGNGEVFFRQIEEKQILDKNTSIEDLSILSRKDKRVFDNIFEFGM